MDVQQNQGLTPEAQKKWEEISPQIEEIWEGILKVANNILQVHLKFGFQDFADKIDPSIEDILLSLKVVGSALDTLYNAGTLDYSEGRTVHNAQQQIWLVQCIAEALKNNNEADYADAIGKLGKQAKF